MEIVRSMLYNPYGAWLFFLCYIYAGMWLIPFADDAPQFNLISEHKSACWVHDGRHYNKLNPIIPAHRVILDAFIKTYWDYYQKLLDYTQTSQHTDAMALNLSLAFAELFSSRTGYDELDARIAKTLAKKESLLLVLLFPFLPLHNNPAELGARVQARIRDINLLMMIG